MPRRLPSGRYRPDAPPKIRFGIGSMLLAVLAAGTSVSVIVAGDSPVTTLYGCVGLLGSACYIYFYYYDLFHKPE
ncbi:MAG: hypothetical protein KIS92_18105 [Planctomycetota bacterium]|nr:hypothetical protein [Planctomycetota bacterium]